MSEKPLNDQEDKETRSRERERERETETETDSTRLKNTRDTGKPTKSSNGAYKKTYVPNDEEDTAKDFDLLIFLRR